MNFYEILDPIHRWDPDYAYNPYAGRTADGEWIEGGISISFLQEHFGQYETATEMNNATEDKGLKLYFDYLVKQDKIPA